jgi:DNA polymerase-3 subunit gamma/tau
MLAFRPGSGGGGGTTSAPSAPPLASASRPISAPAPAAKTVVPAPAAMPASTKSVVAASPVGDAANRPDWHSLMRQLPVKGLVQQLAFQTELQDWRDSAAGVKATIVTPMPQLASEASITRLAEALTTHFGKPIKIVIEKGEVEGKTVAKVDAQIHQEKRMNAEQMIAADPFIQQLEKEFGAKVVGGSVKPL